MEMNILKTAYRIWLAFGFFIFFFGYNLLDTRELVVENTLSEPVEVVLLRVYDDHRYELRLRHNYIHLLRDLTLKHTLAAGETRSYIHEAYNAKIEVLIERNGQFGQVSQLVNKTDVAPPIKIEQTAFLSDIPQATLEYKAQEDRDTEYYLMLFACLPVFNFFGETLYKLFRLIKFMVRKK